MAEVKGGKVVGGRAKFSEVATAWLDEQRGLLAAGQLRPNTFDQYESGLRLHVLPHFGGRTVQAIKPDDLVKWHRQLKAQGASDGSIANHWKPLRMVLGYAVRHGYAASNPADALERRERPKPGPKQIRYLEADEIERLLKACDERYRLALELAIFTGPRSSELRGIRWQDVSLTEGIVRITGQVDRTGERVPYAKTQAGSREVVLMDSLSKRLKEAKLASPFSAPEDYVIASETGTPMNARNLAQRGVGLACERAGLEGITFHVLRHTFASILIAQGRDAVYVASQLGHKRPSITLDTYAHLFGRARQAEQHRSALDRDFGHLLGQVTVK